MKPGIKRLVRFGCVVGVVLSLGLATAGWVVWQMAVHEASRDFPAPGRLVLVGDRLQHLNCLGSGVPTIVLESGLDDRGSTSWAGIHEELGQISRVCSYDRAGLLWSEPGPEPRDAERIAAELHALLAAASEPPPYLVVSHSLGALYTRVFDALHPGEVAGFVLVDPAHPEQEERFPAEVRQRMREGDEKGLPRWVFRVAAPFRMFAPERPTVRTAYWWRSFPEGMLGETAAIQATFAQADRTGSLGDRPLVVLTSGMKMEIPELSSEVNEAFQRTIREAHAELAGLSTNASHRTVDGAGHYIHADRPDAVIEAIRDVTTAVRENTLVPGGTVRAVPVDEQHAVVERAIDVLRDRYVFPETATRMGDSLAADLAAGVYARPLAPDSFAAHLSGRIRSLAGDQHLWVMPQAETEGETADEDALAEEHEERLRRLARTNFGLPDAGVLPGNVGYLNIRQFVDPALAADALASAMRRLNEVDALILDVRQSSGGSPQMVALLASYLFDPAPVHLFDLYLRPADHTEEFWTAPDLPSPRLVEQPVYVLTAASTFSAGEGLAYVLKHLGRATVIGETTAGGANPGGFHRLNPRFVMFVAEGRVSSPVTDSNWEGTGVSPDVETEAGRALDTAHLLLLEGLAGTDGDLWPLIRELRERLR